MIAPTHQERLQREVQEIAEVLSRRSGKTIVEVWQEALSLHRVRFETDVLEANPSEPKHVAGRPCL